MSQWQLFSFLWNKVSTARGFADLFKMEPSLGSEPVNEQDKSYWGKSTEGKSKIKAKNNTLSKLREALKGKTVKGLPWSIFCKLPKIKDRWIDKASSISIEMIQILSWEHISLLLYEYTGDDDDDDDCDAQGNYDKWTSNLPTGSSWRPRVWLHLHMSEIIIVI